jgi:hypothetical protein
MAVCPDNGVIWCYVCDDDVKSIIGFAEDDEAR